MAKRKEAAAIIQQNTMGHGYKVKPGKEEECIDFAFANGFEMVKRVKEKLTYVHSINKCVETVIFMLEKIASEKVCLLAHSMCLEKQKRLGTHMASIDCGMDTHKGQALALLSKHKIQEIDLH